VAANRSFDIGGVRYEVSRLKVRDSLAGLKLVGKVIAPALGEVASFLGKSKPELMAALQAGKAAPLLIKIVEGLDCLPQLLDLFVPATKFMGPTGSMVDLAPFVEDQFSGQPDLCVEFIVCAVQAEYGRFLPESGASLVDKLMKAGD
jgi:hypothetical protein